MNFIVCGAFDNPKRARQYARFSSDKLSEEKANDLMKAWESEGRYPYLWLEEVK
jgi:hypothetical protein